MGAPDDDPASVPSLQGDEMGSASWAARQTEEEGGKENGGEMSDYGSIPLNPRREVSADARHIVKHLWIIFVCLPALLGLLLWLFGVVK